MNGKNQTIVERLRKSKEHSSAASFAEGKREGRKWAENHADTNHLERLAAELDPIEEFCFGESPYPAAEHFFFIIEPDSDGNRSAAREFWLSGFNDDLPDVAYIQGFAEGALALWSEVKEHVLD